MFYFVKNVAKSQKPFVSSSWERISEIPGIIVFEESEITLEALCVSFLWERISETLGVLFFDERNRNSGGFLIFFF